MSIAFVGGFGGGGVLGFRFGKVEIMFIWFLFNFSGVGFFLGGREGSF